MSKKLYKFNIEEKLNELSFEERNKALKLIPLQLGISDYTFYIWRRIKNTDKQDIPATKLTSLAKFFQCPVEELINCKLVSINMNTTTQSVSKLRKKYKLSTL